MKFSKINILQSVLLTIRLYIYLILVFIIFRLVLFVTNLDRLNFPSHTSDIFYALLIGFRFDIVVAGYILLLPFIFLSIQNLFRIKSKIYTMIVFYFIFIESILVFIVCAADIPYFNQFFSHLSVSVLSWFSSPVFVFKMIFQEFRYWGYIFLFVILVFFYYRFLKTAFNKTEFSCRKGKIYFPLLIFFVFLGIMIIGIRGRIEKKSPIRIGTAYFCNDPFLNQLGLNPNFTLIKSCMEKMKKDYDEITLMDNDIAIKNVQRYLHIINPDPNYPLIRNETFDSKDSIKKNVVVIIMESMSAAKMKRFGNPDNLTPFLDSLLNEGYFFENAYSAGIHTHDGIFATLFSFPAIYTKCPMKESTMLKYNGIATTLKHFNYSTIYFTTHDAQFDNIGGFLTNNDFDRIVSQIDYPSDKIVSTLGVPDDYMFEFSIPILNKLYQKRKPFFATFMTASDHGPYYVPDYFKPHSKEIRKQTVEYADFSLRKFITLAALQSWFKNTIFVFVADHGAAMDVTYDLALNYNHVPLLFYAPYLIKEHKVFSNMAGQIDIFPSIMDLLKLSYKNNTLGIDLFREERPYIFVNADDKYGVLNNEWLLIESKNKTAGLYKYRLKDKHNYIDEFDKLAKNMNVYAESNLQVFQYLINTKKQYYSDNAF